MVVRLAGLAVSAWLLVGAAPPPQERVVGDDATIAVTIDGAAGRLMVEPGAPAMPMIDAAFAARAGLKPGMIGVGYRIGPVTVNGASAVARIDYGGGPQKRRVIWTERPYATGADGAIGPGGLPDAVVRFVLRPPVAGERAVALPMIDGGGLFGGRRGHFASVIVNGEVLRIRFDLRHARTMASAGAAASLAEVFGGTLAGDTAMTEIAFGVERPVRRMRLARPLAVGPLSIATIDVRTADFGSAASIADADAPPPDPDEILVTAKGKRDRGRDVLTLGTDALATCSSIVFDKPAKLIRLTCA